MMKNKIPRVLILDFGMKNSLRQALKKFDWELQEISEEMLKLGEFNKFDGILISNGPGDPQDESYKFIVEGLKKALTEKVPILGICLGMQLLALSMGASTYKLKFPHRSINQPCIDDHGRSWMTSQNHGYAVDEKTLPKDWIVTYRHLEDSSVEGIAHTSLPFSGVQFHPEGGPGPELPFIFEEFFQQVIKNKKVL
jgi:carbamoyl-phosphate synthase small subunit